MVKSVEKKKFNHGYPDADKQILLVFTPSYESEVVVKKRRKSRATGHFHASLRQRSYSRYGIGLGMDLSSCFAICHRCNHEWVYFGSRLVSLQKARRPVMIQCPRCHIRVKLDPKNAR